MARAARTRCKRAARATAGSATAPGSAAVKGRAPQAPKQLQAPLRRRGTRMHRHARGTGRPAAHAGCGACMLSTRREPPNRSRAPRGPEPGAQQARACHGELCVAACQRDLRSTASCACLTAVGVCDPELVQGSLCLPRGCQNGCLKVSTCLVSVGEAQNVISMLVTLVTPQRAACSPHKMRKKPCTRSLLWPP